MGKTYVKELTITTKVAIILEGCKDKLEALEKPCNYEDDTQTVIMLDEEVIVNTLGAYDNYLYDVCLDDGSTTKLLGYYSLSQLNESVDIKATLSKYYDDKIIDYFDLELENDSYVYSTPLRTLLSNNRLITHIKTNKHIYNENRNGKYPL